MKSLSRWRRLGVTDERHVCVERQIPPCVAVDSWEGMYKGTVAGQSSHMVILLLSVGGGWLIHGECCRGLLLPASLLVSSTVCVMAVVVAERRGRGDLSS